MNIYYVPETVLGAEGTGGGGHIQISRDLNGACGPVETKCSERKEWMRQVPAAAKRGKEGQGVRKATSRDAEFQVRLGRWEGPEARIQTWAVFLSSPGPLRNVKLTHGQQIGVRARADKGRFSWASSLTIFRDFMETVTAFSYGFWIVRHRARNVGMWWTLFY